MTPAIAAALKAALDRYGLTYAVLIDRDGTVVAEAGDPQRMTYPGLVSALLGPLGSARRTYEWIMSEELRPQTYAQGGDFAILDLLAKRYLVIAFGLPRAVPAGMDAIANYRWKCGIAEHFAETLGPLL